MEPLTFTFTPIREDYVVPLRTHWLRRPLFIIAFTLSGMLAVMMLGISVLGFVVKLSSGMRSGELGPSLLCNLYPLVFPLICAAGFGGLPLLYWVYLPASGARLFQQDERYRADVTWSLDDECIRITTRFEEHKFDWGTFQWALEIKDYYLLVARTVKLAIRFLPKRAFTSSGQEMAFRELVERHLGPIR